jgi:hypothetical protein
MKNKLTLINLALALSGCALNDFFNPDTEEEPRAVNRQYDPTECVRVIVADTLRCVDEPKPPGAPK